MTETNSESAVQMAMRLEQKYGPQSDAPEPPTDKAAPRGPAKVISLPQWGADKYGTPHVVLRSALFAAVHHPRYLKNEELAAQSGIRICFTGMQLNQSDLDVWQHVLHLARKHPLGTQCEFTLRSFLRGLGRKTGNKTWLLDSLRRLTACAVEITQEGQTYADGLLRFRYEDATRKYTLELNPEIVKLFRAGHWTSIDRKQRQLLRSRPLALWLHGFYASHQKPYSRKVSSLHHLSGSRTKSTRKFKQNLVAGLKELQEVGGIRSFQIVEDLVHVELMSRESPRRQAVGLAVVLLAAGVGISRALMDLF